MPVAMSDWPGVGLLMGKSCAVTTPVFEAKTRNPTSVPGWGIVTSYHLTNAKNIVSEAANPAGIGICAPFEIEEATVSPIAGGVASIWAMLASVEEIAAAIRSNSLSNA